MKMPFAGRPAEVLLVDDDPGDVYLAREGLKESGWVLNVHHVDRGEKCLAFLRHEGNYAKAPTPDLVLLDLNMPGMKGTEVLERISEDPALAQVPVIVMSSSRDGADVAKVHALGCRLYVVKGTELSECLQVMRGICDYWFGGASRPARAVAWPQPT